MLKVEMRQMINTRQSSSEQLQHTRVHIPMHLKTILQPNIAHRFTIRFKMSGDIHYKNLNFKPHNLEELLKYKTYLCIFFLLWFFKIYLITQVLFASRCYKFLKGTVYIISAFCCSSESRVCPIPSLDAWFSLFRML